jgi:hypothetical protein
MRMNRVLTDKGKFGALRDGRLQSTADTEKPKDLSDK